MPSRNRFTSILWSSIQVTLARTLGVTLRSYSGYNLHNRYAFEPLHIAGWKLLG